MPGSIISGARSVTGAQLAAHAARAATGFDKLGIGDGDAVALVLRNDYPYLEASVACQQMGAFAVPVNWHSKAEEVEYVLKDSGAKAVVIHADLLHTIMLQSVQGIIPPGVRVLGVETPPEIQRAYGLSDAACRLPAGVENWATWRDRHPPWTQPAKPVRASMIYTSGTTGRPKGVRRQPADLAAQARAREGSVEVWGFGPDMRVAITGPFYHSAPNAYALASLGMGAEVVLMPRFDPEDLLRMIERHKLTHMHMVPTMFVRLLKLPEAVRKRYNLSSLRWVIHAAAPCPPDVKQAMIEWWGPVIHEYYGSTEAGLVTHCDSHEWLKHRGTVGRTTQACKMRILGDDGKDVAPGQIGTIYMRNSALMDFTYNKLDAKRREIEQEGFITSGDMGYVDPDGYLFLCDRKIDMVISGGVNIYPAEIEAVLINLPGVHDCAVFGIPDAEFGEKLAAVVQPSPGANLTAAEVQEHVRRHLADFKVPHLVEFRGDLPREDSGKIFKRRLRDPYWANTGRRI
jgi:long-chain acyl-CoA synthetase